MTTALPAKHGTGEGRAGRGLSGRPGAPLSVIAVWTANQVSDTSRYVENVTPLIHEPSIQRAVTDNITTAVTNAINVPGRTSQVVALLNQRGLTQVGTGSATAR